MKKNTYKKTIKGKVVQHYVKGVCVKQEFVKDYPDSYVGSSGGPAGVGYYDEDDNLLYRTEVNLNKEQTMPLDMVQPEVIKEKESDNDNKNMNIFISHLVKISGVSDVYANCAFYTLADYDRKNPIEAAEKYNKKYFIK